MVVAGEVDPDQSQGALERGSWTTRRSSLDERVLLFSHHCNATDRA
jgi:hypothetical protein